MACSASTCQSNCYRDQPQEEEEDAKHTNTNSIATNTISNNNRNNSHGLCLKCKANPPISADTHADDSRFCADCFRANLFGKFRFAVTSNAMISPTDNVLVAFSGGPSSRVALQFVHEMHSKAQKNFDASRDRSLPVFGVGVAFIDETSVYSVPSSEQDNAIGDITSIVENLALPTKQLYVVPIESVYSEDSGDGRERLKKLLDAVPDATGREDLLLHLRMLALQKIASQNGYNRLLLGSCISRIACHVITATVKGQGYSLPADIQYVDSRWEIPVLLPLRDCLAQELNMLCRLDGLKTVDFIRSPGSGINGLVSSFVSLLQEENPSRECTIVRTAGKLIPFHFNRIQEIDDSNVPLATRRRQKRYNLKPNECFSSESFCFICNGPLSKSDLLSLRNLEQCQTSPDTFVGACCSSCRFQVLPQDPSLLDQFSAVLPRQLVARVKHDNLDNYSVLREQIQDCLLSESDDET
ncbi:putative cytoplasmic tRNA 2-thiolation protein [Rosa chinensis]|uniref:Cytoplasmic tRNA 2-thiolation protein 2 n=1 Tax=Rosa chinensis TaxID=74649 RepID=A0A2P6RE96_ROSCH|nr:cytoplasmic tRNA 2-thiolation protein 2 isoform X1 [Rosa chinensis]PRQ44725.1 putative cytoplasmic tRNA 2-thiolation protein [Rosa chinensis]